MKLLNIYRRNDGGYLLAPDFMQPPMREQRIHGPLEPLGVMELSKLGALSVPVVLELEHTFFALVDKQAFETSQTSP